MPAWVRLLLFVPFTALLIVVCGGCLGWGRDFDRQVWLAAGNGCGDNNPRREMVSDLMDNHLALGMTRRSVRQLLGRPEGLYGDRIEYGLGLRGSCYHLFLTFDTEERLSRMSRSES